MNIDELQKALSSVKENKRHSISPLVKHIACRPTFNIDCYREAVLHRFLDLAECAVNLLEAQQFMSALVIARAAQETFSVLAYISIKLEKFSSDKDLRTLLDTMKRLTIGWKDNEEFPKIINILTCINSVNKKLDNQFRQHYDILSESAHPNYSGVLGSYSQANHATLEVKIGLNENASKGLYNLAESTILICCFLFKKIQADYEEIMSNALNICIELHEQGLLKDIFYEKTYRDRTPRH